MNRPVTVEASSQLFSRSRVVFVGLAFRSATLFFVEVLLARAFSASSYGALTWSLTAVNLSALLSGLGLGTACRRFIPMHIGRGDARLARSTLGFALVVTAVSSLTIAVGLGVLAFYKHSTLTLDASERWLLLLILGAALPFWALQRLFLGTAAGLKRAALKVAIEDFFVPLGFLATVLVARVLGPTPREVALGYVVVYIVSSAILAVGVYRDPGLKLPAAGASAGATTPYRQELMAFSWPLILSEFLGKTTGVIEFLIIGMVAPAAEVGLFRPASDLSATMVLFLMGFSFLYLPLASETHSRGRSWEELNTRVTRLVMLMSFPVFSILMFYPESTLILVYGPRYAGSAGTLRILATAYFFNTAVGFTGLNLIAAGHTRVQLVAKLTSVVLLASAIALLVPRFGTLGAATATLCAMLASNGISLTECRLRLKLQPFDRSYFLVMATLAALATMLKLLTDALPMSPTLRPAVFGAMLVLTMGTLVMRRFLLNEEDRGSLRALVVGR